MSIKRSDAYNLGLYTKRDYYEYSKAIIPKLIIDSGFDINNVKWYACLHLDSTKNFNFHFFFLEIKKTKFRYSDRLISKSAIKKFKSKAVNYLINRDDLFKIKDTLFMGVLKDIKINNLTKINNDHTFKTNIEIKLSKLYKQLPKEHRLQYNSLNLNKARPLLDEIINDILTSPNVVKEYYRYIEKLYDIDFQNKEYYGYSKDDNYVENQIKKLYSRIGNDILSNFKNIKNEAFLDGQKEFLSKYIFKLNFKTSNNITNDKIIDIGNNIYQIANFIRLNNIEKKILIKKWYINSNFKENFDTYYNKLNLNNNSLNTSIFYKTLNDLGISKNKYFKLKQKYYTKVFTNEIFISNALKHIMYENERIEKEIIESMNYIEY